MEGTEILKKRKKNGKLSIWEIKTTLTKTCLLSIFIYLRTKTLKRMENTLYGESEQHDHKTCVSSFFLLGIYQNSKMLAKHPISGNERTLPETCHLGILSVLGNKTLNSI